MNSILQSILNWHQQRHPEYRDTNEANSESIIHIKTLCSDILEPIETKFGTVKITYGYTSQPLLKYIKKNSPGDMSPNIDQHAAMALNNKGNRICKRDGASCDFYVVGYENKMDQIAKYLVKHLPYDRLYFYGKDRPVHISIGPENAQYALIRTARSDGLRVNRKSAIEMAAHTLFDNL
ncbi:hypothetical protein L3V77_10210 [Vibrio sp. DW001]|uniref:hypothetical protein n=1 Tax=Vibrio sp. DW001 TaxID=2912315 RepID=UPI0023AF36EA|nr:hypothetical protein [Vibrio sp. DW001]WED25442.1 hypothetical protein L3V77_10210 [Vibrio sp. DW001]